MKAYNITWDVDMDEALEKLDEMADKEAAEALQILFVRYINLTTEEKHDLAEDRFRHNFVDIAEFMGMPDEIEIPAGITDEKDVSDYISDLTGYCHKGFALDTDAAR